MHDETPSPFRLDGQHALVTGAGKGIGRACVEALVTAGAQVTAVARTQEDLDSIQRIYPGKVQPMVADVTEDSFLDAITKLERLDILVNNVGTNKPQSFVDVERDALDTMLDLNVRSAFLVAQAAARLMVRQG